MQKAKYTAVLATAFAIPAIAVPATALASETTPLDSGLYFNDVNGGQGEYYSFPAWAALSDTERGLLISKYGQENIQILLNAEGYSKIATLKSISDASKPFNEASVDYEEGNITGEFINYETGESIIVDPVDTPVLVESVRAINQTVDENGTLTFSINGKSEAITAEDLPEGYSAEFLASAAKLDDGNKGTTNKNSTGKVKASKGDTFEFQVVIKDAEGNEVDRSERVTATVEKYNEIVTEITEVKTTVNDLEVTDGKLALGDTATLTVKGLLKGADEATVLNPEVTVDKPAILAYDGGTITPKAKGTATVTIKAGDQERKITYTVGDTRVASTATVDTTDLTLATATEESVIVTVKDQYGLAVKGATVKASSTTEGLLAEEQTDTSTDGLEDGEYKVFIKAGSDAKKGIVDIIADGVKVAQVNLTVLKAEAEIADYKLTADSAEFDLKTEEGKADKTITFTAVDKNGLAVPSEMQPTLTGGNPTHKLVSDDKDVATVEDNKVKLAPTAKAGDKVTIKVVRIDDAFETPIKTIEFTVIDSTPVIESVKFTSTPAITTDIADFDLSKYVSVTAVGSKGEVDVKFTVVDSETIEIQEESSGVKLGTVVLTSDLVDVTLTKADGNVDQSIKLVLKEATEEEQVGSLNIAVLDKDNNFIDDVNVAVKIAKKDPVENGGGDGGTGEGAGNSTD